MHNFILNLGAQFTPEEKKKCFPTAHKMVNLTNVARENGMVALEKEIIREDNEFLKIGVNLLVNGTTSDLVESILCSFILSGRCEGTELLDKLIVVQGLIAICERHSPFVVAHFMASMLGEEYLPELINIANKTDDLNVCINEHTFCLPESKKFEERLLKLTITELAHVLMPTDYKVLAIAFQGCSKSFVHSMKEGVSVNYFSQICRALTQMVSTKEAILEHQELILNNLAALQDLGIIVNIGTNSEIR